MIPAFVDNDVNPAKSIPHLVKKGGHLSRNGDVGFNGHGQPSPGFYLLDNFVSIADAPSVIHDYREAIGGKTFGNGFTNATRRASDDRNFLW